MADSRCANPKYQLDVDVMMLEYTVYKAIESQIKNLQHQIEELSHDGSDGVVPSSAATESGNQSAILQQTCDRLISLFRHHHPTEDFSASCDFNLKILEFLVLLEHWIHLSSRTMLGPGSGWKLPNEGRPDFVNPRILPKSLVQRFQQERTIETVLRRNWLHAKHMGNKARDGRRKGMNRNQINQDYDMIDVNNLSAPANSSYTNGSQAQRKPRIAQLDPPNQESLCLNAGITYGLEQNQRLEPAPRDDDIKDHIRTYSLFSITLFELTPRFMELSSDIASIMGPVNEHWIDLAGQLLWQSALERLQQMVKLRRAKQTPYLFTEIKHDFDVRMWVEECFAWGLVDLPSRTPLDRISRELHYLGPTHGSDTSLQDRLLTEDRISAMFDCTMQPGDSSSTRNNESGDPDNPNEVLAWKMARHVRLIRLLDLYVGDIEDHPTRLRDSICEFCKESPIKPFLSALLRYMEGLFEINASPDISGKPVLVQIEEGKLEGVGDADFKKFLDRVGLKISSSTTHGHEKGVNIVKWVK